VLKKSLIRIIFLMASGLLQDIECAISIVYNLRIAETTKYIGVDDVLKRSSTAIATTFGTFRKKYNGTRHECAGELFSIIYAQKNFYVRADAAAALVASFDKGTLFSRTQGDDLLFSGGYSPTLSDRMRITFSGFLGFPTHKDTSLDFVQFGYGHYGLGGQVDGSYNYVENENHWVRAALRLIHFFPRTITESVAGIAEPFRYGLGNVLDVFIAFHSTFNGHIAEVGYDGSKFFGASVHPLFDDAVRKTNYLRHSFFGMYKYRFKFEEVTVSIAAALSCGFDQYPKLYGNKRIVTPWISVGVNF